jgi:hypothetical protein
MFNRRYLDNTAPFSSEEAWIAAGFPTDAPARSRTPQRPKRGDGALGLAARAVAPYIAG